MSYPETHKETPNKTAWRVNKREGVVFHHTAGSYEGAVSWLTSAESRVSAHVVIAKDGRRTILADDADVTWHAGRGEWRGTNPNYIALGVEFELTQQGATLTSDQLASMLEWLEPRWKAYNWSLRNMTHHAAVDPQRKIDLSPNNWAMVQRAINGYFADDSALELEHAIAKALARAKSDVDAALEKFKTSRH